MDPFHVVRLAGDALDRCRQRVQQDTLGHRGRSRDPLYTARRTLHTGDDLLTDRQRERLSVLFADEQHVEVEATWGIYQRIIAAYQHPDRTTGINGRLEHLSGSALGFRNLTNYIARSLLEAGGFRPPLHPQLR
jgi:transposase